MSDDPIFLDMPLEEAMRTQRAIRRLKTEPVDDRLVLHLIELALRAPTGSNQQNWVFVVVRDRDVMRELARLNRAAWRLYAFVGRWKARKSPQALRSLEAGQFQADHFEETPVVVVPCLRGRAPWFPFVAATSFFGSIYPSVQNLLLAARAAGLGANLITLPLWNTRRLKRVLNLPGNVTPCALLPMGWPVGRYGPTTRRPVGQVVHLDAYGQRPWLDSPPFPSS